MKPRNWQLARSIGIKDALFFSKVGSGKASRISTSPECVVLIFFKIGGMFALQPLMHTVIDMMPIPGPFTCKETLC
uniref:Uncharacterized protein n=1 Tax=Anabas testudineus TaxID=64144 RepID=A0A7N6BBS1_ANATE